MATTETDAAAVRGFLSLPMVAGGARPTIDELERLLERDDDPKISIQADGSITTQEPEEYVPIATARRLENERDALASALRTAVSVIEQLIPEPSARGVANVVLAQARAALAALDKS